MDKWAVYNDIDPIACAVTRHLSETGLICPGTVVEKSIKDIHDLDLLGAIQVHMFCGAGLWSVAARLAGWPDDRPIWTASMPCQGWSNAGKRRGFHDSRDLWPYFFRLVAAYRPPVLVGEITSGSAIYPWFDRTAADLEGVGYACRAIDLPACSVDAPHIRQRLWWVGLLPDSDSGGRHRGQSQAQRKTSERTAAQRSSPGRPVSQWADGVPTKFVDGAVRRAKPGLCRLVNGVAERTAVWRLVGNSLVPQLAAQVLIALKDEIDARSL